MLTKWLLNLDCAMGIAWQLSGQAFFVTVYNDKKYKYPKL